MSPPHLSGAEQAYVDEAFQSNWIAPVGPHIQAFEQEMADYLGVNGGAAVSSGTSAIHLALSLLKVGKGDRVFCSTLTFTASANPIVYLGAEPVFIDSELESWNMSPEALERALQNASMKGNLPKALIVVHLYGQSAKMREILKLCHHYEVPVIEDAAESLGATYYGNQTGTMGEFGVLSFNGNKIITTSGGGMLVSNSLNALDKARFLSTQAKDQAIHYQHSELGYNYRISNVLAGIGRGQLKSLDSRVMKRREVFENYAKAFKELDSISFMPEYKGSFSTRWLTAITIDEFISGITSEEVVNYLNHHQIEARPVWKPLHLQPLFKGTEYFSHQPGVNIAERLFESGLCLPSGSNLTMNDQQRVIECVIECLSHSKDREAII